VRRKAVSAPNCCIRFYRATKKKKISRNPSEKINHKV
jgi:hypothetical protein